MTRIRLRPFPAGGSRRLLRCAGAAALLASGAASAIDGSRPDVAAFIADMSGRYGFDPGALAEVLAQAESRKPILDAIARPAEKTLTWTEYRARFVTDRRVNRGVEVYRDHADELARAAAGGVPAQVILGIVGVETLYGENTGRHRVIDALTTLAFDYPPRAEFFRGELAQFLLMAREEALDPLVPLGSYAGAMGIPQFMPSSFRSYAVDGDGDLRRDLWRDWADVFASVANYLSQHGWRSGEPIMTPAEITGADLTGLDTSRSSSTETVGSLRRRGVKFASALPEDAPATLVALTTAADPEYRVGFANFQAITRYNRSPMYASAVSDLADAIAGARASALPPDDAATFGQ